MNATPKKPSTLQFKIFSDPNPWEAEKPTPKLHPLGCVLLSLFLVAAAAYQPLSNPPAYFTLPLFCASILILLSLVRCIPAGIVAALFFLGAHSIGTALTGDGMILGTYVLSTIVSIGIGAFLITVCRDKWLFAIPVLAYGASFLLGGDPVTALLSLIPFPAMGILAYNTMGNRSRVSSICLTSFMFGLLVLSGGALLLSQAGVPLSWEWIVTTLKNAREQTILQLLSDQKFMSAMTAAFADAGVGVDVIIRTYVELVFNLLPALAVCLFNLIGYTSQLICVRSYRNVGMPELETKTARLFVMSALSGLLFFIAGIISIWPGEMTEFGAVVYNLLLILMPGMLLIGVYKLIGDLRQGGSRMWLFLIIICAFFMPYMLIYIISFSGALTTMTRPLFLRMMVKQGVKFPPDEPSDSTADHHRDEDDSDSDSDSDPD